MVKNTRAPSDGGVLKARDTMNGDGRAAAVVVGVGPDQHQALQHAERKARTYGKALLGLASLLCFSVCGNLVSSALFILVFKESRIRGAIQPVVPSDSKAATAPVGTGLTDGAEVPTYDEYMSADEWAPTGMKRCAIAPSGTEACWELADPAMTDIPGNFLDGYMDDNSGLTGTLKVGPAVKTIGARLRLHRAHGPRSVEGELARGDRGARLRCRQPNGHDRDSATVTTIGPYAFAYTELMGLELSKATVLTSIGYGAFFGTGLTGTILVPSEVPIHGVFPSGVSIVSGTRVA